MKRKIPGCLLTTIMLVSISLATSAAPSFPDVESTHWAGMSVEQLAASGVLLGYPDGTYKGAQYATRYEAAAITARAVIELQRIFADSLLKTTSPILSAQETLKRGVDGLDVKIQELQKAINDGVDYKVMLTSTEEAIKGLSEKLASLESKDSELFSSVSTISEQFKDIEAKIVKMNGDIGSKADIPSVNELNANITMLKGMVAALDNKVQASSTVETVARLEKQLSALSNATSDSALRLIIQSVLADDLQKRGFLTATEVEQKAADAANKVMEEVAKLRSDVVAVDGRLSTLDELCRSLVSKSRLDVDERLQQISSTQQSLASDMESYKARLTELESTIDTRQKLAFSQYDIRLKDLSDKVDGMSASSDNKLAVEMSQLRGELTEEINRLKDALAQLSPQVSPVSDNKLTAEMSQLKGELTEELSRLKNALAQLSPKVSSVSDNKFTAEMSQLKGELTEEIDRLKDALAQLPPQVASVSDNKLAAEMSQLKGELTEEINRLKDTLAQLPPQVASVSDNKFTAEMSQLKGELTGEISRLKDTLAQLTPRVSSVSDNKFTVEMSQLKGELTEEINKLKDALAQLTPQVSSVSSAVQNLENAVGEMKSNLSKLDDERAANEKQLTTEVADLDRRLNALEGQQGQPNIQNQKINELEMGVNGLKAALDGIRIMNDSTTTGIGRLDSDIKTTRSDVAAISDQVNSVKSETAQIKKEIVDLRDSLSTVKSDAANTDDRITRVDGALSTYQLEVAKRIDSIEGMVASKVSSSDIESLLTLQKTKLSSVEADFASYKNATENRVLALVDYQTSLENKIEKLTELVTKLNDELVLSRSQTEQVMALAQDAVNKADRVNFAVGDMSRELGSLRTGITDTASSLTDYKQGSDIKFQSIESLVTKTTGLVKTSEAKHDSDIASIQRGLDEAVKRIGGTEGRISSAEIRVQANESSVDRLSRDVYELDSKTASLKLSSEQNTTAVSDTAEALKAVDGRLTALQSEVQVNVTAIDNKAEAAAKEINETKDEMKSIVFRMDNLVERVDSSERGLSDVSSKLDTELEAVKKDIEKVNVRLDETDKKLSKYEPLAGRVDYLEKSLPEMAHDTAVARGFGIFGTVLATILGVYAVVK